MAERPFMQLYVSDYFGKTKHFTLEQHGAYLLLLMCMWNAGGHLPHDERQLARMAGISIKKWRAICDPVMEKMQVDGDRITNDRLLRELRKVEGKIQKCSAAGEEGARRKALKNNKPPSTDAAPTLQQGQIPDTRYQKDSLSQVYRPQPKTESVGGASLRLAAVDGLGLDESPNLWFDGDNLKVTHKQAAELERAYPKLNIRGTALQADAKYPRRQNKNHAPFDYLVACLAGQERDLRVGRVEREEELAGDDMHASSYLHCRDKRVWWRTEGARLLRGGVWNDHLWGPPPWEERTECPPGTFAEIEIDSLRSAFDCALARKAEEMERRDAEISKRSAV